MVAAARILAQVAEVEHVRGGAEQLQEQRAVVIADRAVAQLPLRTAQCLGDAIESARRIAAGEGTIVHAEQADHLERNQAHRHHLAESDAAGEQGLARAIVAKRGIEPVAQHAGGYRFDDTGLGRLVRECLQQCTQLVECTAISRIARCVREQILEQFRQCLLPVRGRAGRRQSALRARQHAQGLQQAVQRVQRAAFQQWQGRDAVDVAIAAAGMSEQQAIERPGPAEGRFGWRIQRGAMFGVQAPARAGRLQPGRSGFEFTRRKMEAFGDGANRQQAEHFVDAEARAGQAQCLHEGLRDRLGRQRAAVADGEGNAVPRHRLAAEHCLHERRVVVDVGRQHGDVAWLQSGIGLEQGAQLLVQYLHFAQAGVAAVHLQRSIGAAAGIKARQGGGFIRSVRARRRAAIEQVALQAMQQTSAQRWIRAFVNGLVKIRMHNVIGKQGADEVAPGSSVGAKQRVFGVGKQRVRRIAQGLARGAQVAPPAADWRQEIEVQGAGACCAGDDP